MIPPKILFCGDNHGHFRHIIKAVEDEKPDAIVLLGDIEPARPLEVELAPILGKTEIHFIHGNYDTDNDFNVRNLFESRLAGLNLDGRVDVVAGVRIAGLGGIFRNASWMPPAAPRYTSYADWLSATRAADRLGEDDFDVVLANKARTNQSTIFADVYDRLSMLEADVLVAHEAPSCHPHGFEAIDDLAQALGVSTVFHGHHHDRLDYQDRWGVLGFRVFGVGFCGVTNLDGTPVRPGDFDDEKGPRR